MSDFGLELSVDDFQSLPSVSHRVLVAASACERLFLCARSFGSSPLDELVGDGIESLWELVSRASPRTAMPSPTGIDRLLSTEPPLPGPAPWLFSDAAMAVSHTLEYAEAGELAHLHLASGRVINSFEQVAEDVLGDGVLGEGGVLAKCCFDLVAFEVGVQVNSLAAVQFVDDVSSGMARTRDVLASEPSRTQQSLLRKHYQ